jgi:hypothetical protein
MNGIDVRLVSYAALGVLMIATIVFTACAFTANHWYTITKDVDYRNRIQPLCIAALVSGAMAIILRLTVL